MQNWVGNFSTVSNGPVQISYDSVGSRSGKANLIAGTTQFAGSDAPLTTSDYAALNGRVVETLPDTIGSIVMIYNIPDGLNGPLNLTAENICHIFQENITQWNDPELVINNPGLTTNATIVPVHEMAKTGTSYTFSDFLNKSTNDWKFGVTQDLSNLQGLGGLHNDGPAAKVATTSYSITYIELNYALSANLRFARLQNKDGKWIDNTTSAVETGVNASAASISGTIPAGNGDWSSISLNWAPGTDSYPISTFSYILVYQNMTELGNEGSALVAFLRFIMTDAAQQVAVPLGYVALPQAVRDMNSKSIESILLNTSSLTPNEIFPYTTINVSSTSLNWNYFGLLVTSAFVSFSIGAFIGILAKKYKK